MNTLGLAMEPDQPESFCSGWIYAFGLYEPRWKIERHLSSDWTQAVVMAKRKSEAAIESFGILIARHLEKVLIEDFEYLITHVPAEEDNELQLFLDFNRCATEILAAAIYSHLNNRKNILQAGVLAQIRHKPIKQHQCRSDAERAENVKGIYAVTRSSLVSGKCVILVDDVLTSGTTMRECATVLKTAGARSVTGIALARTARAKGISIIGNENGLAA
jgi:predicted amidophosphoribosyltransferase